MKVTPISLPELYANWMASNWSMLLGRMPAYQAKEPTPTPAQATSGQEADTEGSSVKQPKKSRAKPAPRIARRSPARRAAPAKKRRTRRKAKGASRR